MKLTAHELDRFGREGYLFFPGMFRPEEVKVLLDEVPHLYAQHRPENVREKGSEAVRTNFAAHLYSYPYAKLARHPRMVEPVVQILGERVYMHQFKINGKMAFDGDVWQWRGRACDLSTPRAGPAIHYRTGRRARRSHARAV